VRGRRGGLKKEKTKRDQNSAMLRKGRKEKEEMKCARGVVAIGARRKSKGLSASSKKDNSTFIASGDI